MEVLALLLTDALAKQDGLEVLVEQVKITCNVVSYMHCMQKREENSYLISYSFYVLLL